MQGRVALLASVLLLACTKPDAPPLPPVPSAAASVAPLASTPPVVASSAPAAEESAAPTPSASAAPDASGAAAACGKKPLPDCPLQAWMKANVNPPLMKSDTATLAIALEKIGPMAPPGYTNWASIAKDGATAAKSGDLAAAKASCRTCHDQYKSKYRTEMRARKV